MTSQPWMKFFPSDWRSDQALRVCSLAARGLWIEMLCVMHTATPYGHLLINGSPVSDTQLAMLAGTSSNQITALVGELELAGVFSRTSKGVIYSRRMTRDEKKAVLARKNGKAGGNPNLCNKKGFPPPDNPPDNSHVNGEDKAQKPDSRVQKEKEGGGGASAREAGEYVAGKTGLKVQACIDRAAKWIAAGFDVQADIIPTVDDLVKSAKRPIGSPNYFDGAIRRHHEERLAPLPEALPSNVSYLPRAAGGRQAPSNAMSPAARDLMAAYRDPNFDYGVGR
jgi:hypothetical protein